jgi:hypothetical protein
MSACSGARGLQAFCSVDEPPRGCERTRDVVGFVVSQLDELGKHSPSLGWIEPSGLFIGFGAA